MNFSREELKLFVNSGKEQIEKVNKAFFIVVLWLIVIICFWTKTFTLFATIVFFGLSLVSTVTYILCLRTKRYEHLQLSFFAMNASLSLLFFWGAYHATSSIRKHDLVVFIFFFLGYLLSIGFWLLYMKRLIRKGKFAQEQKKKASMIGPLIGSIGGVLFAQHIVRFLGDRGVHMVLAGTLLLLSFIWSMGYIPGVKYYLIKKYGFDEDEA